MNASTGRVKKRSFTQKGYEKTSIVIGGELKTFATHRLVYQSFIGDIPSGFEIDHINDDRKDNRLTNLRVITRLDNVRKAAKAHSRSSRGSLNNQSRLSEQDVLNVYWLLSAGARKSTIARAFSVSTTSICNIANGRNWRHLHLEIFGTTPHERMYP
jgi:hypothetical protein